MDKLKFRVCNVLFDIHRRLCYRADKKVGKWVDRRKHYLDMMIKIHKKEKQLAKVIIKKLEESK